VVPNGELLSRHQSPRAIGTAVGLEANGEIAWRHWRDGGKALERGPHCPITTPWNVRGYPSFIVLDRRAAIREQAKQAATTQYIIISTYN
jgi:hypothetical protein